LLTEHSVSKQGGTGVVVPDPADPASGALAMFAADSASRGLGIELVALDGTGAVVRMCVTAAMVNGHGMAHGGYVFLLADTAFACACNLPGPTTVAAGADITFVAPAHEGDVLTAHAVERIRFGRSGVYDVTVRRGDDVIAEFRGRSRTVTGPGRGNAPVPGAAPGPGEGR
jgi:acyl-CoA thioesterase